jgi:hypothetical protein
VDLVVKVQQLDHILQGSSAQEGMPSGFGQVSLAHLPDQAGELRAQQSIPADQVFSSSRLEAGHLSFIVRIQIEIFW